jgi:hypothetical protein
MAKSIPSCPGGTDAGAAAAWRAALNQTTPFLYDFSGLKDYDIMGKFSFSVFGLSSC